MRLFQNSGLYRSYRPRLAQLTEHCTTFKEATAAFLNDRFGAAHFLKPVLDDHPDAFFTNGDDVNAQQLWARENGLTDLSPEAILLAQIEHHRTEVFYNMDPMRFGDDFVSRLPGCVRRSVAWRAAPSSGGKFLRYDLLVNNFPSILEDFRQQGARAEYFFPGHDPVMDSYAHEKRDIDILFVGGYSRHHRRRALMLETIAALRHEANVVMHLDRSRLTTLAETALGWVGPLRQHRRPRSIRQVAVGPVFGRDLLTALGRAKIVVNGAIDMSLSDRGNMRVWEAMGCRAALLSDAGSYPDGMCAGQEFAAYDNAQEASAMARRLLADEQWRAEIAARGYRVVSSRYSKEAQWHSFVRLVS